MTVIVDGTNGVTVPLGLLAVQPLVTTFTSSGTWTPRTASVMVSIFLAGGGGGAGAGFLLGAAGSAGGGGGGGGVVIVMEW